MSNGSSHSRVAIIGGGIGGLTLACALQKKGWGQVTVFEKWSTLKARGGGITIMPKEFGGSLPVLQALDLDDKVAALGLLTQEIEAWHNGQVITKMPFPLGTRVMREGLQRVLLESLKSGTVRLGMGLCSFEEREDRADLHFDDGTTESFDLVVAADGINSTVASEMFPDSKKRFAGTVIYSCLAQGAFLPDGLMYEHHVSSADFGFTIRAFSGSGFEGRWDSVNFNVRSTTPVSSAWDSEGTKAQIKPLLDSLRQHGGGCPDWLERLVEQSDRVMRWGIYEHCPKPSWSSTCARLVLLGDAAHAMAPFLGLGAQTAMLDAHALAEELVRDQSLHQALKAYQHLRKAQCEQITSRAKLEGLLVTSFGLAAAYRNFTMPALRLIHRWFVQSSRWSLRGIGSLLLRLHTAGFFFAEAANSALRALTDRKHE